MSLWLMRQGLDDDTDTDMTNASALESAAFALCCIVAAAILCVASACAWDLLSDFYFFLNDSMALLAAYIIFLFVWYKISIVPEADMKPRRLCLFLL